MRHVYRLIVVLALALIFLLAAFWFAWRRSPDPGEAPAAASFSRRDES